MDMRGCAATPRRPSGHLQKQNGYLASQHRQEMATKPRPSALDLVYNRDGPVDRDRRSTFLIGIIGSLVHFGKDAESCVVTQRKDPTAIRIYRFDERGGNFQAAGDYLSLTPCPLNGRTLLCNRTDQLSPATRKGYPGYGAIHAAYELIIERSVYV